VTPPPPFPRAVHVCCCKVTGDAAFRRFAAAVAKTDPARFGVDNYHFRTQGFFLSGPGAAFPATTRSTSLRRPRLALPGDIPSTEAGSAQQPPLLSDTPGKEDTGGGGGSGGGSGGGGEGNGSWLPFRRAQLDFVGRVEHLNDDWDAVRGTRRSRKCSFLWSRNVRKIREHM